MERKGQILVVEDDHLVAWSLREVLEPAGYEVSLATTVADALASAQATPPDLAILDIRLPGSEDGIAGAELLRRPLDLPIVFLTGEIDPTVKMRAAASQPVAYLTKPVHAGRLIAIIENILAAQRASAPPGRNAAPNSKK